jgi:uncharacterized protein (DUF2336 family)
MTVHSGIEAGMPAPKRDHAWRSEGVFVSSADFRSLADRSPNHPDALFRAAISAFVSMTRPTRADAMRLYDLAEPLLPLASAEAQRFAAAALSDSMTAPPALVRMIAALPPGISAPLLVRSPLLSEIDLIALIGRYGLHHARAISRRRDPGPRLSALLASLRDEDIANRFTGPESSNADKLREQLRAIGLQQTTPESVRPWQNLRDTAATGIPALFQTALADALDIGFGDAGTIMGRKALANAAFRSLGLSAEQAFLLNCALFPVRAVDAIAVRQFLSDYDEVGPGQLREWLDAARAPAETKPAESIEPANSDHEPKSRRLKAS